MAPLQFHNGVDSLELSFITFDDYASLPNDTDLYLAVSVSSHGYSGSNDVWVLGSAFRQFAQELVNLTATRIGAAELEAASPNELKIQLKSVSSLGHLAVSGFTGYEVFREHGCMYHRVEFGFEFEPSQIEVAARHPKVIEYAVTA